MKNQLRMVNHVPYIRITLRPFNAPAWQRLLPKVRNTLTFLALQGYRQAPLIQQALIAIENALICVSEDRLSEAKRFLEIATQATDDASQISHSPILAAERKADRGYKTRQAALNRSLSYMSISMQSCVLYLHQPHPAKFERAALRLEDAAMAIAGMLLVE